MNATRLPPQGKRLVHMWDFQRIIEREIELRSTVMPQPYTIINEGKFAPSVGLVSPGTIVTIVFRANSSLKRKLLDAAAAGDGKTIQRLGARIEQMQADSVARAARSITVERIPAIVDVLYGASWLSQHVLLLDNTEAVWSAAVWSGGALDDKRLQVRSHVANPDTAPCEIVMFFNVPRLSAVERAVVAAIPAELSDIHVRGPSVAWANMLTGGGVYGPDDVPAQQAQDQQGQAQQDQQGQQAQPQAQAQQQQQQQEQGNARQGAQQQQQQQQQADTQQQQHAQQQQERDRGALQQQQGIQQQQAQAQTERQQQQNNQQQQRNADRQVNQQQQQQQQEIQAETKARQQQQQQQQRVQAQTRAQQQQQQQMGRPLDLLRQGFSTLPFDQVKYDTLLGRIDFNSLDATQSVRELLRLREGLLGEGLP